jgi:hypothetical protein
MFFAKMAGQEERQSSGAGSGMAGMALAIPIPNIDGRRHTNSVKKKKLKILAIWPAVKGQFIKSQVRFFFISHANRICFR